eukprot:508408_1
MLITTLSPCLWNDSNLNKRLLLTNNNNNDGNTSMIIISNNKHTYILMNALSLDNIINDFKQEFINSFNIIMNVNIEIQSLQTTELSGDEDEKESGDNSGSIGTGIIVLIIVILIICILIFGLLIYFWFKRKNKNHTIDKGTTEMMNAKRVPTVNDNDENETQ